MKKIEMGNRENGKMGVEFKTERLLMQVSASLSVVYHTNIKIT